MMQGVVGLAFVGAALFLCVASASADGVYEFRLGFKDLAGQIPGVAGELVEDEHYGANGDSIQATTAGLMVWRRADNWTAFTDGSTTWVNGPHGIESRSNDERFDWEADPPAEAEQRTIYPESIPVASIQLQPVGTAAVTELPGVQYQYYHLSAGTLSEVWGQMQRFGPFDSRWQRVPALTNWSMKWRASVLSDGRLADVRLEVGIQVTLPRWNPPSPAPAAEGQEWASVLGRLAAHENEHVAIVLSQTPRVLASLRAARADTANAVFQQEYQRVAQMEINLDLATNHGTR